jgi:hypothetical protein
MQEKHKLYLGDTRKVVAEMVEREELEPLGIDVNYYKVKGKHVNNP